jgi:alpha-beta hydrolase superfamily lysophospholipase
MIEEITFSSDNFELKGTLHLPQTPKPPVVIGLHGLMSDRLSPKQIALAEACNAVGLAYFRLDHRGCGESEGNFTEVTSLVGRCNDVFSALNTLERRGDLENRIGLFGSSMGGTVSLVVAGRLGAATVVALAAPLRSGDIVRSSDNSDHIPDLPPSFFKDNLSFDISGDIPGVQNLLLFHGDADEVVPYSHGREIFDLAPEPKEMVVHKDGDHRMSRPDHQKDFMDRSVAWFSRWLRIDD